MSEIFFKLFILLSLLISVRCAITRFPSNTIFHPRASLRLNCSSDVAGVPVAWGLNISPVFLSDALVGNYDQLFTVDRTEGYDLLNKSLPTVACCGTYSCAEYDGGVAPGAFANVSVIEELTGTPNVTHAWPNDFVGITCTEKFCNVTVPSVTFFRNDSTSDAIPVQVVSDSTSVTATAAVLASDLFDGSFITCIANYSSLGISFSTKIGPINKLAAANADNTAATTIATPTGLSTTSSAAVPSQATAGANKTANKSLEIILPAVIGGTVGLGILIAVIIFLSRKSKKEGRPEAAGRAVVASNRPGMYGNGYQMQYPGYPGNWANNGYNFSKVQMPYYYRGPAGRHLRVGPTGSYYVPT